MSLVIFLVATASATPLTFNNETATRVITTTVQSGQLDKEYTVGDFDNDGDPDVVLAIADGIFGRKRNMVYRNDNGVLRESSALVPEFIIDTLSRRPFLRDVNADGWLDLVVVNDELASGYAGETHMWLNSHPGGVFAGFVQNDAMLNGAGGDSCGAAMEDFDGDGDVDLYSGNYPGGAQDTIYMNSGAGVFTDVTASQAPTDSDYTTDVVTADYNGDGTLDISLGNHFDPSRIYYNNLNGQSFDGDFSTPGSVDVLVNGTTYHNATEPIDVDNDGDIDMYMANYSGDLDALFINTGLSNGKVVWAVDTNTLAGFDSQTVETSKPETVDINNDGRTDILLPAQDGPPTLLRNTSIGGVPSFIDWTPPQFPSGSAVNAFSSTFMHVDDDAHLDMVIFGHTADYVLRGQPNPIYTAGGLNGEMPDTSNGSATIEGKGFRGGSGLFLSPNATSHDQMSVVARACGDIALTIGSERAGFATSDRAGRGNEEVAFLDGISGGRIGVYVQLLSACGDADGDGDMDLADYQAAVACFSAPTDQCVTIFDANMDGDLTVADRDILFADTQGANRPTRTRYTIDVLTR